MTFKAAIVEHVVGLCADIVFVLWLVLTAASMELATSTLSSTLRKEAAPIAGLITVMAKRGVPIAANHTQQ